MDLSQLKTMSRADITRDIRSALDDMGVQYQTFGDEDSPNMFGFTVPLEGPINSMNVGFMINERDYYVVAVTSLVGDVKNEKQTATLIRLVTLINNALIHGRFCFDLSNGRITFQHSASTVGLEEIPNGQIPMLLAICHIHWEKNMKKFLGVIYGAMSGEEAFALGDEKAKE